MKRIVPFFLAAVLTALLFTQCTKDDLSAVFNARFYTTKAAGSLTLYIDDAYKGELPYFSKAPVCGQDYGDAQNPLTMQLKSGEYKIVGKDDRGNVTSYGIIKISKNRMSTSGGIGGLSLDNNGDCLVVGLSE